MQQTQMIHCRISYPTMASRAQRKMYCGVHSLEKKQSDFIAFVILKYHMICPDFFGKDTKNIEKKAAWPEGGFADFESW